MSSPSTTTEDRDPLLDEVLAGYLRAAQAGTAPPRQALLAEYPGLADELARFFADQDHVERLAAPLRHLVPGRAALGAGCALGDYELLEEVAHGGMGVVYRARQRSLGRVVAVKVLRAGPLAAAPEWRRFRVEAEAVAHLDHPHIVPIYEVGEHEGLHYFSMKFVGGGSLARHTGAFRADPRAAARVAARVARAVQHAHERGILHRDLKPANVLLDAAPDLPVTEWQPLVSDFGLAKRLAGPEGTGTGGADTATAAPGLTLAGAVVGTPGYMAPEQARGEPPTTAADVYGVGAVLYELLTGRAPFVGEDAAEVLRQVQECEPPAVRLLNPRVGRDLDAVCRASLGKDPARRYGSARELAEDLERCQAGRPVRVLPVGPVGRFRRWCRRQPVVAGLLGVLLVALALVCWQWRRAEDHLRAEEAERARAQDNLARVEKLLDDVTNRLSEKHLARVPGLQPARREILEAALGHYQAVLAQRSGDPHLRSELASTYYRVGLLTQATGAPAEALGAFVQALDLYQELGEERPEDAGLRLALARTHNRIANVHALAGRPLEALASYRRARPLLEPLRDDPGSGEAARLELALTAGNTGTLHLDAGRLRDARACHEEAVALEEDLLRRHPGSRSYRCALAGALNNLGNVRNLQGERPAGRRCLDRARALLVALGPQAADDPGVQETLGTVLLRIGSGQCVDRDWAEALATLEEAHRLLSRLCQANPSVLSYQDELATTWRQRGHAYRESRRETRALECYGEALQIAERVHRLDPEAPAYRKALARGWFDSAVVYHRQNRRDEAVGALQKARDHYRRLVRDDPQHVDYQSSLGMTLNNLAIDLRQDRPEEALEAVRESCEVNAAALARAPEVARHRELLSTSYKILAGLQRRLGRPDEAAAATRARRDLWPDSPTNLYEAARDLALAADAAAPGREKLPADPEARRAGYRAEAVGCLARAVANGYADPAGLEREPAFDGLRRRDDFQKLLGQLKAKKKGAAR
jgi:serine/threonine-protein kinase